MGILLFGRRSGTPNAEECLLYVIEEESDADGYPAWRLPHIKGLKKWDEGTWGLGHMPQYSRVYTEEPQPTYFHPILSPLNIGLRKDPCSAFMLPRFLDFPIPILAG